ncbi:hypothetical protein CDG60_12265 [Acinetobacter chinensis]|uniref:HK97 gp10 family phage protein n=1 Tax=Acinetobacter chinensis TaxID=2004650 RepID=A0A3B7LY09_9GAMM|nr:HK97-gp10 family putative phage morphogenesis protein [Acinetobacter chinensis]AXY57271.1 hypothetical protein CDG60_12265 [Acinetobacter chinensis]
MSAVSFELQGVDELTRKLNSLSDVRKVRNAAKRSLRKGTNIVKDAAKQNALQIDDENTREAIWKNIDSREGRTRSLNYIVMKIGVRGGAATNKHSKEIIFKERRKKGAAKQVVNSDKIALAGGDTRYWRLVEFGSVHNVPIPFMRNALSKNIQQVSTTFVSAFNVEVDKLIAGAV